MYISAVETYLPGCNVSNEELSGIINFKPALIEKLFGNYGRHFSTNLRTGEITSNTADLISVVIKKLLSDNENGIRDIEFIITSTATPNFLLPTSINEACFKLEIGNLETYQIMGGCSGAVQAMNMANYIIKSGIHKKGIVIGVECANKFLNLFEKNTSNFPPKELINYVLFGDAVGGCIVEANPSPGFIYVKDIIYKYTGLKEKAGQLANWEGSRHDFLKNKPMISEEYKLIEKLVPEMTEQINHELKIKNSAGKDTRWFMPPQLSGKMVNNICKKMSIPEYKIFTLVHEIGNCANAALYFQLKEFYDLAEEGDDGIAISIESSRWLSSGMYLRKF